ncbi:MAG: recombination-associated protein RdgC [Gammaproteobacteria bacterium RIFCSPHIGHO2_12_FULL_35_23]|nr:MAG: recombination-associated protein RdgC [Gammaproteobacteria bacterium RIFCSPHIGHO2_12_FULL_35_23]
MWFKNVQLFRLISPLTYDAEALAQILKPLAFTPCLPSLPESLGWISPLEQSEASLVYAANGYLMICLQFEEKILPATVIRQELETKMKVIETTEDRKVKLKEKLSLKDEVIYSLRPRAFSRFTKLYAYFDTKRNLLIVNSVNSKKIEKFVAFLKRTATHIKFEVPTVKKPSAELTYWLQHQKTPGSFVIEKGCVLQDPSQQTRIIRCQQQNLFAQSIQALIKDGCEVKQLALSWNDEINFNLAEDFTLRNIRLQDELLTTSKEEYIETQAQQFDTDFVMMTETFAGLFTQLLDHFIKEKSEFTAEKVEVVV